MKKIDISKLTVKRLKLKLKQADKPLKRELISELLKDPRRGVQKLGRRENERLKKHQQERERLKRIFKHEREIKDKGYSLIAGTDEVGRGSLAGPVFASAVILPDEVIENRKYIPELNDSKKLTEKKREELYKFIMKTAVAVGTGEVAARKIDQINILQATFMAISQAVKELKKEPDWVMVDGNLKPQLPCPCSSFTNGDSRVGSISAASIVAKVERDRMMIRYSSRYPEYSFESNKGYGSFEHRKAIEKYGLSPLHRKTFIKKEPSQTQLF